MALYTFPGGEPDASCEAQPTRVARDVFSLGHGLHMGRVDALGPAAEVVEVHPTWDGADMLFIEPSMREVMLTSLGGLVPSHNLRPEGVLFRPLPNPAPQVIDEPHGAGEQARAVPSKVLRCVAFGEPFSPVVTWRNRCGVAAPAHA